jgi:type I restriction enzyme S subunit
MAVSSDGLPRGWARTTVNEVGAIRLGRQRSPAKQTGRYSTKYLRAGNITADGLDLSDVLEMDFTQAERRIFVLKHGDVVLAEASGSARHVGRAALWREEVPDCCYQNTVIRFRPHAAIAEYSLILFRHYLVSGVFARTARGVGILHLGASRFASLPFLLPPLAEQERIAYEVQRRTAELREAETSLRSALARLEDQDHVILAAAVAGGLVESEAILAERERRSFEHAESLLARVADNRIEPPLLFDIIDGQVEHAEEQWPSLLPPGWIWARVDQVGEVTIGRQRAPKYQRGAHMRPYLRVANVFEDRVDASEVLEMNFTPAEYETYALRYGDILLNEGQSPELVGRPAMYRDEVPGACFQNTLLRFRASAAVDPDFALIVFRHYLHAGEFRKVARWTTNIAHLSLKRFTAMPFPLPPLAEQRRIAVEARRRLDASATQQAAVRASLDRLPAMEAELLAAAVNGLLAPQDEADESAASLLERLGPPPTEQSERSMNLEAEEASTPMVTRRSLGDGSVPTIPLSEVLRAEGRPLNLPDLFSRAGYDRDSTEHVEQFFITLRDELNLSIRKAGGTGEDVLVEAIPHASE